MKKIQNYTGTDSENLDRPEIEHFGNCDVCGALVVDSLRSHSLIDASWTKLDGRHPGA
jgi:hypothetical protein